MAKNHNCPTGQQRFLAKPLEFIKSIMSKHNDILKAVEKLIYKKRKNSISAHLKTWFELSEDRYFGNLEDNRFQVWRFTRGAQGFHPVIVGEITINRQGEPTLNLKPMLNPLGIILSIVGTIGTGLLTFFMTYGNFSFLIASLVSLGTALTLVLIVFFIYRYETKYHVVQLKEKIKNELQQNV